MAFVFGNDAFPLSRVGAGQPVSDAMQTYSTQLAKTGDPNGEGTHWPLYDGEDNLLVLDEPITTRTKHEAAQCDFWDTLR